MVDALERALTSRTIHNDYGLGGEFYWRYLRDFHKLADMTGKLDAAEPAEEEWRKAYLTKGL